MEYWFNESRGKDVWPAQYKHDVVGMIWDGGNGYATYFSATPRGSTASSGSRRRRCWAISSKTEVREAKFPRDAARSRREGKDGERSAAWGRSWANVILSHAAQVDPEWAVAQFDELWDANGQVAHEGSLSASRISPPTRCDRSDIRRAGGG
jgi:hypothetical protein